MSKGVRIMGISYKKLWMLLLERDIKKSTFRQELNLASGTWTKLNKGEEVSLSILLRICGSEIFVRLCGRTTDRSFFRAAFLYTSGDELNVCA